MHASPLRIVVCGGLAEPELLIVKSALARLPGKADVTWIGGPPDNWPQSIGQADLCVVLQGWPDEFPAATVQAMLSIGITSRLVCCQGAWCASAGRTRADWPLAVCVPVELFAARLKLELNVLDGVRDPLPYTASRDEIFAALYCAETASAPTAQLGIESPDHAYARELQSIAAGSIQTERQGAVLVDVDPCDLTTTAQLAQAVQAGSPGRVIALSGFPRAEHRVACMAAGAAACLSKFDPLTEVYACIEDSRGRPQQAGGT